MATSNRGINMLQAVGTVVPRAKGGVVVALHNGFAALDLETELRTIIDPEQANELCKQNQAERAAER